MLPSGERQDAGLHPRHLRLVGPRSLAQPQAHWRASRASRASSFGRRVGLVRLGKAPRGVAFRLLVGSHCWKLLFIFSAGLKQMEAGPTQIGCNPHGSLLVPFVGPQVAIVSTESPRNHPHLGSIGERFCLFFPYFFGGLDPAELRFSGSLFFGVAGALLEGAETGLTRPTGTKSTKVCLYSYD